MLWKFSQCSLRKHELAAKKEPSIFFYPEPAIFILVCSSHNCKYCLCKYPLKRTKTRFFFCNILYRQGLISKPWFLASLSDMYKAFQMYYYISTSNMLLGAMLLFNPVCWYVHIFLLVRWETTFVCSKKVTIDRNLYSSIIFSHLATSIHLLYIRQSGGVRSNS